MEAAYTCDTGTGGWVVEEGSTVIRYRPSCRQPDEAPSEMS